MLADDRGGLRSQEATCHAKLPGFVLQRAAQRTIANDGEQAVRISLLHGRHGAKQVRAALLLHQPANEEDAGAGCVSARRLELAEIDPDVVDAELLLWQSRGDGALPNEMRDA